LLGNVHYFRLSLVLASQREGSVDFLLYCSV
jgi:hypothetical protein